MRHFLQLYLHCVWSTWDRQPLITPAIEPQLYAAIQDQCHKMECNALAIGGLADHVHVLVALTTSVTIARLMMQMKGATSHLVTHQLQPGSFFKWQAGYGAFTCNKASPPYITSYIGEQKQRHLAGDLVVDLELCSPKM